MKKKIIIKLSEEDRRIIRQLEKGSFGKWINLDHPNKVRVSKKTYTKKDRRKNKIK